VIEPGRVNIKIELKHPFSAEFPQFTGFDVRGIVMMPETYTFPQAGVSAAWDGNSDLALVGADGYTRLFNPEEFPEDEIGPPALGYITGKFGTPGIEAANLNPYLIFVPLSGKERNHFATNTSATRTYDFKLPAGPVSIGYAVDVSWYPMDDPVVNVPDDFPISANCPEAYKIWASIGKGLTPTGTRSANVRLEVSDWQGLDTIERVLLEAPDLFDGQVEAVYSTVEDENFIFYGEIQNSKLAPIGDYPLLISVEDAESDPNLGAIASYQLLTTHVTLTGVWIRELVYIPAGDFLMGSDPEVDPYSNYLEEPQHMHPTGEYFIGKYEISNEEYAAFIADNGYHNPSYWSAEGWEWRTTAGHTKPGSWNEWPEIGTTNGIQFPDYPTFSLYWFEAEAFCNWAGGRLPTEAEWEKAARGTEGFIFPWGNEWDANKCRCEKDNPVDTGPTPVGSYSPEGDSPYGVSDTIGNVWEWAQEWYQPMIYEQYATGDFTPPSESDPNDSKVVRSSPYNLKYSMGYNRAARRFSYQNGNTSLIGVRIVFDQ
jgi:formylglycine-generating enzyme required for sulfatase activity